MLCNFILGPAHRSFPGQTDFSKLLFLEQTQVYRRRALLGVSAAKKVKVQQKKGGGHRQPVALCYCGAKHHG